MAYTDLIPEEIQNAYEIHEWRHASAILATDFPEQWDDLLQVLGTFRLFASEITTPGGGRSPIAIRIDSHFYRLGWREHAFHTSVKVDAEELEAPTHKVDNVKGRVACDLEWNNKTEFFDRDLSNFRLLFELRAISAGIIITRATHLQVLFNSLGKGPSYGASTTHMDKLVPRLRGGSGGGCPIIVFGIKDTLYVNDVAYPKKFIPAVPAHGAIDPRTVAHIANAGFQPPV